MWPVAVSGLCAEHVDITMALFFINRLLSYTLCEQVKYFPLMKQNGAVCFNTFFNAITMKIKGLNNIPLVVGY
jgi:hypothetical protein